VQGHEQDKFNHL